MEIKNILVTGSEGYIGAVLVPMLLKKKYKVIGIDNGYFGVFNKNKNFIFKKKDIRDINKKDLSNIDAIIHLAALSNDPIGELNKKLTTDINYYATINLAKLAKKNGVKKFIFSSSCSIYGINDLGIVDEKTKPKPLTEYAKSKIGSEKYLIKLGNNNFFVNILRNSTVYGYSPSFRADLVVNNLISWGLTTGEIRIMSDGTPWRPLIDVRDLSNIFIQFLEDNRFIIQNEIFNIGFNENNFQVKDILNKIKKYLPNCKIIYTGEHGKDSRSYRVNFDKFKNFFPNIKQKWNLDKSINDLIIKLNKIKNLKSNFINGNYTRLETIKKLLNNKKINNNLKPI